MSDEEELDKLKLRAEWLNELQTATKTEGPFFNNDRFTQLILPVRMGGNWLLLASDPEKRETFTVMFNKWDWNEPKVREILVYLTKIIKIVTIDMGFRLFSISHLENTKEWKLRLKGDKIKLRVWKYFNTDN